VAVGLVVCAVLLATALLLAVPVHVAFQLKGIEAFSGLITIRWLFGLVRFRAPYPSVTKSPQPETAANAGKVQAKPNKRNARANVVAVLRQAAFRRRALRLVKDLVRAAHPQQLRLRMRLGLGDPADTGRLWAFMGPLSALAQNLHNAQVQIEPEFIDTVFEIEARGRLRLVPLQVLGVLISFALSPASIRAWRTAQSHA
jgi:hypothetical protein